MGITAGASYSPGFLPEGTFGTVTQEAQTLKESINDELSELRERERDWNLEMPKWLELVGQDNDEQGTIRSRFYMCVGGLFTNSQLSVGLCMYRAHVQVR